MEDEFTKYEILVLKELEGEITSPEKEELEAWLLDPINREYFLEQKKLWNLTGELRRMEKINAETARIKVERKLFGKTSLSLFRRYLERVAAIVSIPLLFASLWFYFNRYTPDEPVETTAFNKIEVPLGMRSSVILPDSTLVWLNAGSTLLYPVPFGSHERRVELSGEGYFEVKKDSGKSFFVSAKGIDIRVVGTSFNCCAYPDAKYTETMLVEGEIEMSVKDRESRIVMHPGELATLTGNQSRIEVRKVHSDKYISWKSGKLVFRDDPMGKVIEKLERWYNVEFIVDNIEILGYVYSATFSGESLDQMLKMFALSAPIEYRIVPRKKLADNSYEKQVIHITTKTNLKDMKK